MKKNTSPPLIPSTESILSIKSKIHKQSNKTGRKIVALSLRPSIALEFKIESDRLEIHRNKIFISMWENYKKDVQSASSILSKLPKKTNETGRKIVGLSLPPSTALEFEIESARLGINRNKIFISMWEKYKEDI